MDAVPRDRDLEAGAGEVTTGAHAPRVMILGCRGIPAAHGGFETFAERLSLYLAGRGWRVTVACQSERPGRDTWRGVHRLHVPASLPGPAGTILFDLRTAIAAVRQRDPVLMLGYNTALLWLLFKAGRIRNVANMDGIEWQRSKWPRPVRAWFRANEWVGARLADHLVADHPEIGRHLAAHVDARHISVIPYGADHVEHVDPAPVYAINLEPGRYALVVARPEPENSILEIVTAFAAAPRGWRLVLLGDYNPAANPYHRAVKQAASAETCFAGAIYEAGKVAALRQHAGLYVHGHQVGGTNPSLVEALGAGCPVLAHDNRFNRWVAGPAMRYFRDSHDCAEGFTALLGNGPALAVMRDAAYARAEEAFRWETVLRAYEDLLLAWQ